MAPNSTNRRRFIALSGGVGGAKLALGLSRVLPPGDVTVIANTGDDFEHLGLSISPDIDTLTYVLAGIDNPATGWGRRDETWSFMDSIGALGGEDWFRLGDRDLALHVERTRRLRLGQTLSEVTADICRRLGIGARVVPMSNDRVRTRVRGDAGWIDFQDYFVRQRCRPVVHELAFDGVTLARPHADITAALASRPSSRIILVVGPLTAFPLMIGDTATTGAPLALIASRMPGIARIGSMLMKGLDGQTITARTSPESSAAVISAWGRASAAPSKTSSWTTGRHCRRTK